MAGRSIIGWIAGSATIAAALALAALAVVPGRASVSVSAVASVSLAPSVCPGTAASPFGPNACVFSDKMSQAKIQSDLNAIAAAHEKAVEAEGFEPFEQCDAAFHELIFIASRNELLAALHAMLRLIRSQEQWLGIKRRSFTPGRRADYCDEHAAIVRALLCRDAEAAEKAMLMHLDSVGRNLLNAQ